MMNNIHPADELRNPQNACLPDPRLKNDAPDMHARWRAISALNFNADVPEAVVQHFETAKNVFLYAWFVYRFHMVAEQYVLSTLEFALRERILQENSNKLKKHIGSGLKKMLVIAREQAWISNKRFEPGFELAQRNAMDRYKNKMIDLMNEHGLSEITLDYSTVEITEEDWSYNWIEHFESILPQLRNEHAHGTSNLYPTVFGTFEIVHNLIEQLFTVSKD